MAQAYRPGPVDTNIPPSVAVNGPHAGLHSPAAVQSPAAVHSPGAVHSPAGVQPNTSYDPNGMRPRLLFCLEQRLSLT